MIKKVILSFIMLILTTVSGSAGTQHKMRIAILDLRPDAVSESTARQVSEIVRGELVKGKGLSVIERASMKDILQEQSFQKTGCTDDSCAVEMGRLLSARKILIGSVMKMGTRIIITGRIVDVEKGVAEFSHNEAMPEEGELFELSEMFSKNIINIMEGKKVEKKEYKIVKKPKQKAEPAEKPGIVPEPKKEAIAVPVPEMSSFDTIELASVKGKYYNLLQVLNCPSESGSYGNFYEWGHWTGTSWCGQIAKPGYWVWVKPNWYIWGNTRNQ